MGIITSYQKEAISRTYRTLTKDQLTMMIYGICKNIMAKWCYPFKNPDEVSQKEINQFLDTVDFHSKRVRVNYPDLKKTYDVPYDIYLRGTYRYAETLETKLGTNMDKVLFEKVIRSLYGDNPSCISTLDIKKTDSGDYNFIFNKNISTNLKDGNIDTFAKAILSFYSNCRFGTIIVSSYIDKASYRTLLFIENANNVINIFYYDPQVSNKQDIYNKIEEMFNVFVKPVASSMGIKDLIVNKYGINAPCISTLDINKTDSDDYTFVFNKNISTNFKDGNIDAFAKAILSIYSKCKFGAIIVSSYREQAGHRTLLFIENVNDVLHVYYYDPHGSNKLSWSNKENIYNKLEEVFSVFVKPAASSTGIKNLFVHKYETICLLGIQALSFGYDIGMCQIFSSLWLYTVVKVIVETTKKNIILPLTSDWLYLIDDYFISQFDRKQRYNAMLLFVSKLFNFYIRNNANYLSELSEYNNFLLKYQKIENFEVPYDSKPKEDIKESEEYIVKVARKGIEEARKDEEEKKRQEGGFIAESLLPPKRPSTRVLKRNKKQGGGFIAASLLGREQEKSKAEKRKAQEESEVEEETYEQYSKKVKTQQQKEQEYSKSIRGRIPFMTKKKLFDDCLYDSDCISGCCYWNDLEKVRYCNESSSCPRI